MTRAFFDGNLRVVEPRGTKKEEGKYIRQREERERERERETGYIFPHRVAGLRALRVPPRALNQFHVSTNEEGNLTGREGVGQCDSHVSFFAIVRSPAGHRARRTATTRRSVKKKKLNCATMRNDEINLRLRIVEYA